MNTPTEEQLSAALRDLVAGQPFAPDPVVIQRRGEHLRRRRRLVQGVGVAGVAAAVAAAAITVSVAPHPGTTVSGAVAQPHAGQIAPPISPAPPPSVPTTRLATLAAAITAAPAHQSGDATMVVRDQRYPTGADVTDYDLYGDDGAYYYAPDRAGLPSQVRAGHNQADGMFQRELAAAKYAATGDLDVAAERMADAPLAPGQQVHDSGVTQQHDGVVNKDNYVWEDSMSAFVAGSGNAQIRAGVLRLLSTMPTIAITEGATDGRPTLVITAAGTPEVDPAHPETWTIDARTGVPITFVNGDPASPDVTVHYTVTRVSLADVRAGRI